MTELQRYSARQSDEVICTYQDGCIEVVLRGAVDLTMNSTLAGIVEDVRVHDGPVRVHTEQVTYMDSAVLAMIARLAHRQPGRVTVVNPPPGVRFLLDIAQLGDWIAISES